MKKLLSLSLLIIGFTACTCKCKIDPDQKLTINDPIKVNVQNLPSTGNCQKIVPFFKTADQAEATKGITLPTPAFITGFNCNFQMSGVVFQKQNNEPTSSIVQIPVTGSIVFANLNPSPSITYAIWGYSLE